MAFLEERTDGAKVYGPYMSTTIHRMIVVIYKADGKTTSKSYARWLMEKHLGRSLDPVAETVDHIDGNPLNDNLDNLQLLPLADNARKSARPIEWYEFECPECGEPAVKQARNVRSNWKKSRSGPFCSRRCAGRASHTGA